MGVGGRVAVRLGEDGRGLGVWSGGVGRSCRGGWVLERARTPAPCLWSESARGPLLTKPGVVPVLMVGVDPVAVEADLVAGRLVCPDCGARLAPWGSGRERELRSRAGGRRFRPRRSICTGLGCGVADDEGVVPLPDTRPW